MTRKLIVERNLTTAEINFIQNIVEEIGYRPLLRLLGGLAVQEVPNTLENWSNGKTDLVIETRNTLVSLGHKLAHLLQTESNKGESSGDNPTQMP